MTLGSNSDVNKAYVGAALSGIVFAGVLYFKYQHAQRRKRYPKDVVILHQFPRGLRAPSVSPYCLKLETWLRMADIKYEPCRGLRYNGVDIEDSQFCIDFLTKKLEKDLNEHLTEEQKALARAVMKLTEESLKWGLPLRRFVYNQDPKETGLSKIALMVNKIKTKNAAYGQGYGRHTEQDVYDICKADMKAINDIIGKNKFVFSDRPCDVDASVYGICAQFLYHDFGPVHDYLLSDCPNLIRYLKTVKEIYWPDWDTLVTEKKLFIL